MSDYRGFCDFKVNFMNPVPVFAGDLILTELLRDSLNVRIATASYIQQFKSLYKLLGLSLRAS